MDPIEILGRVRTPLTPPGFTGLPPPLDPTGGCAPRPLLCVDQCSLLGGASRHLAHPSAFAPSGQWQNKSQQNVFGLFLNTMGSMRGSGSSALLGVSSPPGLRSIVFVALKLPGFSERVRVLALSSVSSPPGAWPPLYFGTNIPNFMYS